MLCNCACITHFTKGLDGGLHQVVGVGRTLRLRQDVVDAHAFEDGTHRTTGHNSRTFGSRKDEHFGATIASSLFVRNSAFDDGNFHQILLSGFDTLSNGCGDFAGLTEAIADDALTITHHNNGSESESASTLGDLGYTIDSNESIFQFFIVCVYSVCHNL